MRKTVLLITMTLLISVLELSDNHAGTVASNTNESHSGMAAQVTIPPDPTDLHVTEVTSSSIAIAWTDNASNEDGYKIERCVGANCTDFQWLANMPTNVASIIDWGLSKNRTYKYRVYAHNAAGNSGYSNIVAGTTTR